MSTTTPNPMFLQPTPTQAQPAQKVRDDIPPEPELTPEQIERIVEDARYSEIPQSKRPTPVPVPDQPKMTLPAKSEPLNSSTKPLDQELKEGPEHQPKGPFTPTPTPTSTPAPAPAPAPAPSPVKSTAGVK